MELLKQKLWTKITFALLGAWVGHIENTALIKSAEGLVSIERLIDLDTGAEVPVLAALPLGLRLPNTGDKFV